MAAFMQVDLSAFPSDGSALIWLRVSDEICHRQSPRESGLRCGILYTLASSRMVDILCNLSSVVYTNLDNLEDAIVADDVHGRAV